MSRQIAFMVVGAVLGGGSIAYIYRGSVWQLPVALLYGLVLAALVRLLVR